ncbi:insulinase family protein [Aquimarina sp. ERC-38]|uniref:M16 family metallopeptidase n=1 Tax=Aquimarina sp. ERC-38 TaxID=2949996 RepID=UPI0022483E10|nr:M16 family metallopeptidase [Aquimarina sp. ERC-38]UZO80307.1 insulinase family protein [Aquimarina sp. ERC-38]
MKNQIYLIYMLCVVFFFSCKKESDQIASVEKEYAIKNEKDSNGYAYQEVANDPTGLRLYTLDNGLKVYLGQNQEEPKIQTLIAVKAGSTYDPADNTGLAHYLEHMVFKGTDEMGTQNFEEENKLIQQISDLYEKHKATSDSVAKKAIYKEIDQISKEASKLAIANEYDKLVNSLGSEGTNAFTSQEQTVYVNKIPSNELDKWLQIESERFSQLVLRLFHTELEAVYEEFNRGQDSDGRKQYYAVLEGLYPTHPYGTQTTIGKSEHLKNPSMEAIHNYFNTYYVPNNMAVILVGDLDYDTTIKMVDKAFGSYEKKEVVQPEFSEEQPITSPIKKEIFGPTSESLYLAYRTPGKGTKDEIMVSLIDMILANSKAGLIDLNLNQKQKVQNASSFTNFDREYGFHLLYGTPKANQSLDEVRDLLLAQVEQVKKGNFDDWLIEAVVNDLKVNKIKEYENASSVAYAYLDAYIYDLPWDEYLQTLDKMKEITKQEVVAYANTLYGTNYVEVHKLKGEDPSVIKVNNPGITPVDLNRDKESIFLTKINQIESPELSPKFVNYQTAISKANTTSGLPLAYVKNENNDLFELNFILDMGQDHNKKVSLATGYLNFLGTDTYTPEDLQKEFYKLGVNYSVTASSDRTIIKLSGLEENLDKGLKLLEHLLENAKADPKTYADYVDSILKGREDGKTQKGNILWNGLFNYGKYGENSPLRNIYTAQELKDLNPEELVNTIKDLKNYKHRLFYYGKDVDNAIKVVDQYHSIPENLKDYPEQTIYEQKETGGNVYFVNYDMVQAEMLLLAKGSEFDAEKMAGSLLFNTYFGSGLSSIVFQEIRESKSLAYSAFSQYAQARDKGKSNYLYAYIGTQANKMPEAVDAMMDLMTTMPEAQEQFEQAKEATLKKIAAQRITKANIFWNYERLKRLGITNDNREAIYNQIKSMTMSDLKGFFEENIKGEQYNMLVIGNKKDVDLKALQKIGKVQELEIDYLFNYENSDEAVKL